MAGNEEVHVTAEVRWAASLFLALLAAFGMRGGGKRAAGTRPSDENDDCPHCGGVLKSADGVLSCKSCHRVPNEG